RRLDDRHRHAALRLRGGPGHPPHPGRPLSPDRPFRAPPPSPAPRLTAATRRWQAWRAERDLLAGEQRRLAARAAALRCRATRGARERLPGLELRLRAVSRRLAGLLRDDQPQRDLLRLLRPLGFRKALALLPAGLAGAAAAALRRLLREPDRGR
ncbi:MAG TPA: hypothetical protein VHR45_19035, partial [Thermoanaerobaculia bacterium]|nr:hypothetical protein [Thermoanaerobaculia bacterium]